MKEIAKKNLSEYRAEVFQLTQKLKKLACKAAYPDPLIKGTPGTVYRKCGYKHCKCAKSLEMRHGPYKVIQVYKDGKQRQIALRKDQGDVWERAKRYHQQMQYLAQIKNICKKLTNHFEQMINQRTEEWEK
jgi:hypothetical protein